MELEVIYKIVSPNGKVYIGRTKNFNGRMAEHKHMAKINKSKYALYKAINKYGWDNMIKEIICEIDASHSQTVEEEFIKMYDSVNKGYNNKFQQALKYFQHLLLHNHSNRVCYCFLSINVYPSGCKLIIQNS